MERPGVVSADDYLDLPRNPQTWLVKPLIPTSGAALIYSPPKVGKTWAAMQLALAISDPQQESWLGFPVDQHGPCVFLQLDTPRGVFAGRFDTLKKGGVRYTRDFLVGDRESLKFFPFDVLETDHAAYLRDIIQEVSPIAVIVDTLRECHSGDENDSTVARNVIANLTGAVNPAALILVSHNRKPAPDAHNDLMGDHRGSGYIVGRMDAVCRLTRNKLYFSGRSIEEGDVKLQRLDTGLWLPITDDSNVLAVQMLANTSFPTLRAKAKALAPRIGKQEEATMSMLRRMVAAGPVTQRHSLTQDIDTPPQPSDVLTDIQNIYGNWEGLTKS